MTDTCPVCGWSYLREEPVPENPDPDHKPNAPGIEYVHFWQATGNGRVEIGGCTAYENGETVAWDPPSDNTESEDT